MKVIPMYLRLVIPYDTEIGVWMSSLDVFFGCLLRNDDVFGCLLWNDDMEKMPT